ncbi:PilN domain-containing protein [Methylibium sp.]|uniref:PilN domain-containing protein n=1 Tax=Methylibium sp. TaxID=2067992 RepID=UPI003D0F9240
MSAVPLRLGFQAEPLARGHWPGWLALVLAVGLTAVLARQHLDTQERLGALQVRKDILEKRLQPARARGAAAPDADTARQLRRANQIIDQLALPWDELFRAVEAADARSLGLLALAPNAQDRSLHLSGEARSVAELLAYVDRLAAQRGMSQVHLLDYETVVRDGSSVISFTLAAKWQAS